MIGVDDAVGEHVRADSWALVRAIQDGDIDQFGVLYQRYAGMLVGYFVARGHDSGTAEDLTSETFVRALNGIDAIVDQGKDVRAWLVTIARNLARDHARCGRTRFEVVVADIPEQSRPLNGPEGAVLARFELAELAARFRSLSQEQRQCVVYRRILDRSVSDTAALMNRSSLAIRALLYRALRQLSAAKG